jgi:hypothetical protein
MPTEADIRAAFGELAEQAPDAETVLAAVTDPNAQHAAARRRSVRVLAPVAAAAAVAVVAAVVAVIALPVGTSGTKQPAPVPAAPPAVSFSCTQPDSACIPRYYLDIGGSIKDRITGATVAVARLPRPYDVIDAVAGSADDRTFVLAAQAGKGYASRPVKLFIAQFDAASRSVSVSALPIPAIGPGPLITGLALSPDGRQLATAVLTGPSRNDSLLSVYSLAGQITGRALKTWQSPGTLGESPYDPSAISWSSTGMIAINWLTGKEPTSGIRLLNTAAPSGSLLAHSRFVVDSQRTLGYAFSWDGVLTPDGARIVAVLWQVVTPPQIHNQVEEYSASTGKPVLTLDPRTGVAAYANETLEWTNSSGTLLVVAESPRPGKAVEFGLLGGGKFRPIPGAPAPTGSWFEIAF